MRIDLLPHPRIAAAAMVSLFAISCGGGSSAITGYSVVLQAGVSNSVSAGDAVLLSIASMHSDGTLSELDPSATVTWSNAPLVSAIPATQADAGASDPIPAFGAGATAIFVTNPARTDRPNDLSNLLFFVDPGTAVAPMLLVTATISGVTPAGTATATFAVGPPLVGDATNGAALYGATGANCAACHGATGAGSPQNPDGSYSYNGASYAYPAQGLNAAAGNLASDPAWNQALLALAVRTDMDNQGVELRAPMPDFLDEKIPGFDAPLTTQQIADIYAFLQTQSQ